MTITLAAVASLAIGAFMVFFGLKLIKFSLKYIVVLAVCFAASHGFWEYQDANAPNAVVIPDTDRIKFDYPIHHVECAAQVQVLEDNEIYFELYLPLDTLLAVTSTDGKVRFYQVEGDEKRHHLFSVVELEEPIGWMTKYAKE